MNALYQPKIDRERKRANAALAGSLAEFPPADQIAAREFTWSSKHKPKNADLVAARAELVQDIARYEDLRARGGDAVGDYDLTVSSGDDGPAALHMALSLKDAHISWGRGKILYLEARVCLQPSLF